MEEKEEAQERGYRDYVMASIRRAEEKLALMTDPQRISIARHNLKDLRRAYRRGVPAESYNSVGLTVSVVVE